MKIVIYSYNEFSMYWQSQIQLKNTCTEKLGTEEETVGVQSDCEVYDTGPKTSNTIEVCNFLISCDLCTIEFGIVLSISPPPPAGSCSIWNHSTFGGGRKQGHYQR